MMHDVETDIIQRSGKRIFTRITLPSAPRAISVLIHGLGGTSNQSHLREIEETLSQQQIITITFDARHTCGKSEGEFSSATATHLLQDLEDVIADMTQREWWNASLPLVLVGHSLGGLVALLYARTHTSVAGVVLIAPALSWRFSFSGFLLRSIPWLIRGYTMIDIHGVPQRLNRTFLIDYFRHSGFRDAEALKIPVSIISGGEDKTVSAFAHRRLHAVLPKSTLSIIPSARHNFGGYEKELAKKVLSEIERRILSI